MRSSSLPHRRFPGLRFLCGLIACAAIESAPAGEAALANHLTAVAATLGARERMTLSQIPALDRRLLALRAYVRAGSNLDSRWSWTEQEIRIYERSAEYRRLLEDLARVRAEFERQNPGYTLYANTQVRSLDVQLERWNSNLGVAKTAASLLRAAQAALAQAPDRPNSSSIASFKRFLANWRPAPVAPLAAPGLSAHGRMRAVDFQIMRDGRIVAATEVGAVAREWEATGWSRKLKQAIVASGTQFEGPLKSPNEPWHYEYISSSLRSQLGYTPAPVVPHLPRATLTPGSSSCAQNPSHRLLLSMT
jgi:hypothetical protein